MRMLPSVPYYHLENSLLCSDESLFGGSVPIHVLHYFKLLDSYNGKLRKSSLLTTPQLQQMKFFHTGLVLFHFHWMPNAPFLLYLRERGLIIVYKLHVSCKKGSPRLTVIFAALQSNPFTVSNHLTSF